MDSWDLRAMLSREFLQIREPKNMHRQQQAQQENPCILMANRLQEIIDKELKTIGGKEAFLKMSHEQLDDFVYNKLDKEFSEFYMGRQNNSIIAAWYLYSKGPSIAPAPYSGQGGFKEQFRQGEDLKNNQTHHFAAYFSSLDS